MATLVGTQTDFLDALKELVELEYAAIDAYETAINRLEKSTYKEKMEEFKKDHDQHLKDLSELLVNNNHKVPEKSLVGKQLLTSGKVILANMVGDKMILQAMLSNEIDTNTAYERMNNHKDKWEEAEEIIREGFRDEKRHKAWLENECS